MGEKEEWSVLTEHLETSFCVWPRHGVHSIVTLASITGPINSSDPINSFNADKKVSRVEILKYVLSLLTFWDNQDMLTI